MMYCKLILLHLIRAHLEHGVMVHILADIVQVVVLASSTNAPDKTS